MEIQMKKLKGDRKTLKNLELTVLKNTKKNAKIQNIESSKDIETK